MSAASFLGISGSIALYGYDGFLYSIGFLVAWLVALLLVAELLRNSGRYTMADLLAYRMRQTPVRTAAATSTDRGVDLLPAGADGRRRRPGRAAARHHSPAVKNLVIVGVGVLMIIYVTFGGMKGTTWVQIVKAVLLMAGTLLITILVLAEFGFNLSDLLGAAADEVRQGRGVPAARPALRQGPGCGKLDFISLGLALVLGTAGLPHILIRFYTVPDRQGRPQVGALGDRADRRLLPDDAGARLRRRRAGRHRHEISQIAKSGRQPGLAAAGRRRSAAGADAGRRGAAGGDLGGRLRHHPGGGRRPDPGVVVLVGARPLRQRDHEGQGHRAERAQRGPDRRRRASARSPSRWPSRRSG